jgi:hypothetical protein
MPILLASALRVVWIRIRAPEGLSNLAMLRDNDKVASPLDLILGALQPGVYARAVRSNSANAPVI